MVNSLIKLNWPICTAQFMYHVYWTIYSHNLSLKVVFLFHSFLVFIVLTLNSKTAISTLYLIHDLEDIVVFLGLNVFNSKN